jgi:peptidoglycan/xylan/chitin deacetylase (PgdA/CDA1 family)
VTIDDLPGASGAGRPLTLADLRDINRRMLQALRAARVPAIGFVNEGKLHVQGERDQRTAILLDWLDAGMTLGNHTFRHKGLSNTPLSEYQDDVLRGEVITRAILDLRQQSLVWFRHPYTHTGPTAEIKQAFQAFLAQHGYKAAPFTIEHADFAFAALYADALASNDAANARAISRAYLEHLDRMCAFYEELARDTFGREIPQILLTHVNRLNADVLPELLARISRRGYRFVTLEDALADDAYRTPDLYVGTNGPSWLHRFRVARKLRDRLPDEPDMPRDLAERYRALTTSFREKSKRPADAGSTSDRAAAGP